MTRSAPVVRVFVGGASAADALARFLAELIQDSVTRSGQCSLALSGGSTPRLLYERMARPDLAELVPWDAVHLYWSDERVGLTNDTESNYLLAREALIEQVPLRASNIHPIDCTQPPEAAAAAYELLLGTEPLDIILLGMGADGHTASLFPGGPELQEEAGTALVTQSPRPPPSRVSLSLRTINAARTVVFFVLGPEKAPRVASVMAELQGDLRATQPAAMVRPETGSLYWYLDRAAAGSLQEGGTAG